MKKGILYLNRQSHQWEVKETIGTIDLTYPLYFNHNCNKFLNALRDNSEVSFTLIDEFSNPELFEEIPFMEGTYKAKLIV